jgi:hypothetical protein
LWDWQRKIMWKKEMAPEWCRRRWGRWSLLWLCCGKWWQCWSSNAQKRRGIGAVQSASLQYQFSPSSWFTKIRLLQAQSMWYISKDWQPHQPPDTWQGYTPKANSNAPLTFEEVDNPGQWNSFCFWPRYNTKGNKEYLGHWTPCGAKMVGE